VDAGAQQRRAEVPAHAADALLRGAVDPVHDGVVAADGDWLGVGEGVGVDAFADGFGQAEQGGSGCCWVCVG
jgi:hypothetical protein